jgi:hypothetical protein
LNIGRIFRTVTTPTVWGMLIARYWHQLVRALLWRCLDSLFNRFLKLPLEAFNSTLLAEGFWDNPNQFLRLRLFLEGVPPHRRGRLAALLRTPGDRSRRTLEALGFNIFFCLSDTPVSDEDWSTAYRLLTQVKTHRDLLHLSLPDGLPPDLFYDTALKRARHPRPPLDHPVWAECLADAFRLHRFYSVIFESNDISTVVLSHPWKNEYGTALWHALKRDITSFHLNGMYEAMRVRRFDKPEDFFRPMEALPFHEFKAMPNAIRTGLSRAGHCYLKERTQQTNSDINQVLAYRSSEKSNNFLMRLGLSNRLPVVLVCCHVWYDFPHSFGMRNFTDFLDWTQVVLEVARAKRDVIWIIKPHPTESWYGGFRLSQLTQGLPDHIHVLDEESSVLNALEISSAVVTVHGTVTVEAVARGIPVLCADVSMFSDWEFAKTATSRADFVEWLEKIETIPRPNECQIDRAKAYAFLSIGPGSHADGLLRLPADHVSPSAIFGNLFKLILDQGDLVRRQGVLVSDWLSSETTSFSVHHKLRSQEISTSINLRDRGVDNGQ